MKLLIGIPAYNESSMIGKIVKSIPKKIDRIDERDILVVNDGSTDDTAKIASSVGASVLTHVLNRGLGGALKTIFAYARLNDYDLLVTFDADGQHLPQDIEKVINPILNQNKDVVIGTRWMKRNNAPFIRYIVNQCANIITYILFGIWSTDTQSGLRAFNKKAINKIKIVSDGMEVSSEFFKEIFRNKLSYGEIPIKAVYTEYSKVKGQKIDNAPEVFFQLILRMLK